MLTAWRGGDAREDLRRRAHGTIGLSRVHPQRSKPVIGLVGGIGAGKSLVASMMEAMGAKVIDSDKLAHEVYSEPAVRAVVRSWWGDTVFLSSGDVDRRAIARIVFADAGELRRLEGLLYPRIESRRGEIVRSAQSDPQVSVIVVDAPKLFEAGVDRECDAIVFVDADRATRAARVRSSRGWDETELERRERSQAPLEEKRSKADFVILNTADPDSLRRQVSDVLAQIWASSKVRKRPGFDEASSRT